MAEGGSPHDYDVKDTKDGNILDSHLLECPVCLEQLRRPKSLPCLHTFCQECLGTYITKDLSGEMASATSFPCPICRTLTQPVNPSEDKENWAQQFPTNSLIQEFVDTSNKLGEPFFCKFCKKKGNVETPATIWCRTCNIPLCQSCEVNLHDIVLSGCHKVHLSPEDIFTVHQESPPVRCEKHSEEMKYYCEHHQVLGCTTCITIDHRRCGVVTTANEYCDTLKSNSEWDEWTESLQKASESIELLLKQFCEDIKGMAEQQAEAVTSITELRERLDARLNVIQKDLMDQLASVTKRGTDNLELSIRKCERLMSAILNTLGSSKKAVQLNNSMATILVYQRGQAEIQLCKDLVTEISESFATVRIQHVVDPGLGTPENDAPISLGKVAIDIEPRRLPDGVGYLTRPLSQRHARQIGKFSIKCRSDTRDCLSVGVVYLPNGHIILGDYNNQKVKLFTAEGKYLDEMKVPGNPADLCIVNATSVAVAVRDPSAVHVIKISSSKLSPSSVIKVPNRQQCRGVAYVDGEFIVSTSDKEVCKVTKDGKVDTLYTCSAHCFHLACDQRQRYIFASQITSTLGEVAVFRLSGHDRIPTVDAMKVGLAKDACGLDVDRDGNVYICGRESHNIVQMSGDGNKARELLTSPEGVDRPRAVSVCGDKFVVTNVSPGQQNEVHVFQLY